MALIAAAAARPYSRSGLGPCSFLVSVVGVALISKLIADAEQDLKHTLTEYLNEELKEQLSEHLN